MTDGHDVTSRTEVLPPGECTHGAARRLCSSVHQFLIYSTFVLVIYLFGLIVVSLLAVQKLSA